MLSLNYSIPAADRFVYFNLSEDTSDKDVINKMAQCRQFVIDESNDVWIGGTDCCESTISLFRVTNPANGHTWTFVTNIYSEIKQWSDQDSMHPCFGVMMGKMNMELLKTMPIDRTIITAPYTNQKLSEAYQKFYQIYDPARIYFGPIFTHRIKDRYYKDVTIKSLTKKINMFYTIYPDKDYYCTITRGIPANLEYSIYYKGEFVGYMR